jgi:hypothetical protein
LADSLSVIPDPYTVYATEHLTYDLSAYLFSATVQAGLGAEFTSLAGIPRPEQHFVRAYAGVAIDLFTDGPVRAGLIDLELGACSINGITVSADGNGSGTVGQYTRLSNTDSRCGTRPLEGLLPFTLGTPFVVSLNAYASSGNFEASVFRKVYTTFRLYELNDDGSAGAAVAAQIQTAPEPGTWLLSFAGLLVAAFARRALVSHVLNCRKFDETQPRKQITGEGEQQANLLFCVRYGSPPPARGLPSDDISGFTRPQTVTKTSMTISKFARRYILI